MWGKRKEKRRLEVRRGEEERVVGKSESREKEEEKKVKAVLK